ncbi:hypothetical protein CLIB1444_07S03070 [[Candida] jaroonii]|uniref:Uncharacterized protein n=1 Tax=[Candida] jaroonii TaxID=467808 RepID=A0ACA9YAN6_9ASCO|nr:hypothetical protein CLIB1444_07S03070 [[Candida] jaroonii]
MDDTTDVDESIGQIGSSTPTNSSFLSPIKKFDNLNLNNLSDIYEDDKNDTNEIDNSDFLKGLNAEVDEGEDENDYSSDWAGDQTIEHSTDEEDLVEIKPVFLNKRKRDTSDVEMITPTSNNQSASSNYDDSKMSICSNITSTSLSNFKLSFSNSDSTPCPPMKKRFKYETPNKKKLLNLSNSIKTNVKELPNFKQSEIEEDYHSGSSSPIEAIKNQQSTPISQSTPSNSRAPSPIESKGTINGYTMINREIPNGVDVEYDNENINQPEEESFDIGNERINDPYLNEPEILHDNLEIRNNYMTNKYKLPLLIDLPSTKKEILEVLNSENIYNFFKFIKLPKESLKDLLKRERIRWHPDKWVNESLDIQFISNISSSINVIIESYDL